MTLESLDSQIQYVNISGTRFPFNFKLLSASDLRVDWVDTQGVLHSLVPDVEFILELNIATSGGTVVLTDPAIQGGTLFIQRELSYTQPTKWVDNNYLSMKILEDSFDRIVMLIQQLHSTKVVYDPTTVWKGYWTSNTVYSTGVNVIGPDYNVYTALNSHTATDWSNDITAGLWLKIIDVVALAGSANDTFMVKENGPSDPAVYVGTLLSKVPVGSIIQFCPGHFGSSLNTGYTSMELNTVAGINALVNPQGFYVCDGSFLLVQGSRYFNNPGGYLPNLINKFVMFGNTSGTTGGRNTTAEHTHTVPSTHMTTTATAMNTHATTLSAEYLGPHTHTSNIGIWGTPNVASGHGVKGIANVNTTTNTGNNCFGYGHTHYVAGHAHNATLPTLSTSTNPAADNRPEFLTVFPLLRVV